MTYRTSAGHSEERGLLLPDPTERSVSIGAVEQFIRAKRLLTEQDDVLTCQSAADSLRGFLTDVNARADEMLRESPGRAAILLAQALTLAAEAGQYRRETNPGRTTAAKLLDIEADVRRAAVVSAKGFLRASFFGTLEAAIDAEVVPLLDGLDPVASPRRFMPFRVNLVGIVFDRLNSFSLRCPDTPQAEFLRELYKYKYLRFGTSGVRGRWNVDLTPQRAVHVASAILDFLSAKDVPSYVGATNLSGRTVVVGHDTRSDADVLARMIADECVRRGFPVQMSDGAAPTPALVYWLTEQLPPDSVAGLINCTASHNPPEWQGIKFNPALGYPAPTNVTDFIAARANELALLGGEAQLGLVGGARDALDETSPSGRTTLSNFDPRDPYIDWLFKAGAGDCRISLDISRLREFYQDKLIIVDEMHGAGRDYLTAALGKLGIEPVALHHELRGDLGGLAYANPEEQFLDLLKIQVREQGAVLGLGMDTDADRFGVVDADGTYYRPNQVLPILLFYLKLRGELGRVVSTQTGSPLIEAIASSMEYNREHWPQAVLPAYVNHPFYVHAHGELRLMETHASFSVPVGIKYIEEVPRFDLAYRPAAPLPEDWRCRLLIGGEESSGLTTRGHLADKDGPWANLLVINMLAYFDQAHGLSSIGAVWDYLTSQPGLWKSYGGLEDTEMPNTGRVDLDASHEVKDQILSRLLTEAELPSAVFGAKVQGEILYVGGVQYDIAEIRLTVADDDRHFVRLRSSGTEPILRIYVESSQPSVAKSLMRSAMDFVDAVAAKAIEESSSDWGLAELLSTTAPGPLTMSAVTNLLQGGRMSRSAVRRNLSTLATATFGAGNAVDLRSRTVIAEWLRTLSS